MTFPPSGVPLRDVCETTDMLLRAGATIDELNCVRKHLDRLKGGRLAQIAAPARVLALLLSYVLGDRPDVIASGPLSPDPTKFADALTIVDRHRVRDRISASALEISGVRDTRPGSGVPGSRGTVFSVATRRETVPWHVQVQRRRGGGRPGCRLQSPSDWGCQTVSIQRYRACPVTGRAIRYVTCKRQRPR